MNAELMMLIGGLAAFVLTIHWVRRRNLRYVPLSAGRRGP